jgi:20S proteasome subunit beta 3
MVQGMNGGTFLAMAGRNSVLLATDSRYSSHRLKSFLLDMRPRDIYRVGDNTLIGSIGMEVGTMVLMDSLRSILLAHNKDDIEPVNVARVISNILYETGLPISPIVVGLDNQGDPFLCSMDGLGACTRSTSFVVVGTANAETLALCESMYRSGLEVDQLVELATICLKRAFQRNILSGGDVRLVTMHNGRIYSKLVTVEDV